MARLSRKVVAEEFARKAKSFHSEEKNPMNIGCWGLFLWGEVSELIKRGEVIPNAGYTKENHTIWCKPSQEFYDKYIKSLMS